MTAHACVDVTPRTDKRKIPAPINTLLYGNWITVTPGTSLWRIKIQSNGDFI